MKTNVMMVYVVVDRDLAMGNNANTVISVCKTLKLAQKIKKEIDENRQRDLDEDCRNGLSVFIEESLYLEKEPKKK
jgi:hypothetical protein